MSAELTERQMKIPYAIAARYAKQHTDAFDELVSIGNLALVEAMASYDPSKGAALTSWLMTCVRHALQKEHDPNRYGNAQRWKKLASLDADEAFASSVTASASPEADPSLLTDAADATAKALECLSPLDRAVYLMREAQGMKLREIAERLGVCYQAVGQRLARIRGRLTARPSRGVSRRINAWYLVDDAAKTLEGPGSLKRLLAARGVTGETKGEGRVAVLMADKRLAGLRAVRGPEAVVLAREGYRAKVP